MLKHACNCLINSYFQEIIGSLAILTLETAQLAWKKWTLFLQNFDVQKPLFDVVHYWNVVLRWFYHLLKNVSWGALKKCILLFYSLLVTYRWLHKIQFIIWSTYFFLKINVALEQNIHLVLHFLIYLNILQQNLRWKLVYRRHIYWFMKHLRWYWSRFIIF